MLELVDYPSILHYSVDKAVCIDGLSKKRSYLIAVNDALSTDYKERHLNNWLQYEMGRGKTKTPNTVHKYNIRKFILSSDFPDVLIDYFNLK